MGFGGEDSDQVREGGELELATREALFAVVEDLCADALAVLVFDDLQWADQSTLQFIGSMASRVTDMGSLVVCTSRRLPLRLGPRGPRTRARTGWDSLTASEQRVAELAAQGLSNPEIAERLLVSRHTVVTHMSHVLGKPGLRSRYELAAARDS